MEPGEVAAKVRKVYESRGVVPSEERIAWAVEQVLSEDTNPSHKTLDDYRFQG